MCEEVGEELGKPAFETLTAEILPLLSACRWTEKRARRVLRPRRVRGGGIFQIGQQHRVVRAPLGDVAIIATWNYPIQLLGVQLIHAIAGGNRVWVKPSERTPRSQGLLLDLAQEAGLGDDRLSRVDASRGAGERLLTEHRFDHVVFTGSTDVGRSIARTLSESLTPSTLELSGSDSAIVLADADVDLAARAVAFALRLNAGQTCMAPRRVLVERGVYERFVAGLAGALAEPRDETIARPDELERSGALARDAVERHGGSWISGASGVPPFVVGWQKHETGPASGLVPGLVSGLVSGDHFGPAMAVVGVDCADEALAVHAGIPKKLATAVFTRDLKRADSLAPRLGSTVVIINDCVVPTGHPGLGIGGLGESGWGVSRGAEGLLAMTRPVFVSRTGRVVRTPLSEPDAAIRRRIARFAAWLYG